MSCGELSREDLHGDLPDEPGPCAQAQIIPAPEPARVIPVRPPPGRQQAHGLVGDGDDLRAVGGFQAGVPTALPDRRQPPAQPPGGDPGPDGNGVPSSRAMVRSTYRGSDRTRPAAPPRLHPGGDPGTAARPARRGIHDPAGSTRQLRAMTPPGGSSGHARRGRSARFRA